MMPRWSLAIGGGAMLVAGCTDRETLAEAVSPPRDTPAAASTAPPTRPVVEPAPIASTGSATPAPSADDADALVQRAQAALDAHDAKTAEALAREALSRDDQNTDAMVVIGDVALDGHRAAEALAAYERALAVDSNDGWALVRASEALVALGRTTEARSRLRAYATAHPDAIPDVFDALGWQELDAGDPARAKLAFGQALKVSSEKDADAWYGLAVVAADAENAKEVARALERVFALDPGRRTEALNEEAFEPVRQSAEWRELFGKKK